MKKTTNKKLSLRTETIRALTANEFSSVVGGNLQPVQAGFIMKDTNFVRTSG